MAKTFQIDESSQGAQELLAYLRSLSFVKEIGDTVLTDEHLQILNERRAKFLSGESKTYSLEEVESFARNSIK